MVAIAISLILAEVYLVAAIAIPSTLKIRGMLHPQLLSVPLVVDNPE
ncbi:hypothetical protein [Scytonema hofmannii]|nr:hypothetical protein [Scytonema hofmannii]